MMCMLLAIPSRHWNTSEMKVVWNAMLSDIRMPGKTGFELVRQLQELRPEMKIVLMTAFKINKSEAQLVLPSTKVDAFIGKPFNIRELQEAMSEIKSMR